MYLCICIADVVFHFGLTIQGVHFRTGISRKSRKLCHRGVLNRLEKLAIATMACVGVPGSCRPILSAMAMARTGITMPMGIPSDYGDAWRALRQSETSGRPLGAAAWIAELETRTGRTLAPQKRGPKPKNRVFSKLAP